MKTVVTIVILALTAGTLKAQEDRELDVQPREYQRQEIQTIFKRPHKIGGYGALTNKFTTINGSYANLTGGYGGVFINHKVLIGVGAAATTNYIPVPLEYSISPADRMSYGFGQVGLVTEYALWSNRAVHLTFNLFSGAGFTFQYDRPVNWYNDHNYDPQPYAYGDNDENWFMVMEPGVQLELNLFKWMRVSPGISYRQTYGSNARGLTDSNMSNTTYSVTFKFGKF